MTLSLAPPTPEPSSSDRQYSQSAYPDSRLLPLLRFWHFKRKPDLHRLGLVHGVRLRAGIYEQNKE